jgi:uncharacterized protein YjgD (DUF1641 family)
MFKWGSSNMSEQDRVLQNVTNLMSIRKNEVCFDRGMGIDADYIDKSEKKITSETITNLIDMIAEKEPRASLSISDLVDLNEYGEYSLKAVISNA